MDLVVEIARGIGLPNAVRAVTGLELAVFEPQFRLWLEDWEDPDRASLANYLHDFQALLADHDAILDKREQDAAIPMTFVEAAISRAFLAGSMETLIDGLPGLSPPEPALALHQEAVEYFGRSLAWLTLDFQHADTRDDSKRVAANATIPEINARVLLLKRNLSNLRFIFNLGD